MIKRLILAAAVGLTLNGCVAAPAWLVVVAPTIGWVASVNNLGAQWLKFKTSETPTAPSGPYCYVGDIAGVGNVFVPCAAPLP